MEAKQIFEEIMNEECIKIVQLHGGVTNLSYSIFTKDNHYILRIPGKGTNEYINRYWEINNLKKLSNLNLSPKIYYSNSDTGIIISEYLEDNIPMSKEDIYDYERVNLICKSLSQLHLSSIIFDNEFDIEEAKKSYIEILKKMEVILPLEFQKHIPMLEKIMKTLFQNYPKELVPCQGDPKLNNFLLQDNKIWMIDLEYSGMADKYYDLVNIVMTNNLVKEEEEIILNTYEKYYGQKLDMKKYLLYKITIDYLWIYWHLIKLFQGEMVEYNEYSWKNRLNRALSNIKVLEELE